VTNFGKRTWSFECDIVRLTTRSL